MDAAEKSKITQLDIFRKEELERAQKQREDFESFAKKSFKGLFARYNELEFFFINHDDEIENLKREVELLREKVNS